MNPLVALSWPAGGAGILAAAALLSLALNAFLFLALRRRCRRQKEHDRTEQFLKSTTARLAEAERIARMGHWDWDIKGNAIHRSDELYRIFNQTADSFDPSYEAFLAAIHPEDRERVDEALHAALERRRPYSVEFRLVLPDGAVRHIVSQAEVDFDESGAPRRMMGVMQDITELRQAEQALHFTQYAMDHASDAVFWLTPDARFTYVNDAACRSLGYTREELLSLKVFDIDPKFTPDMWEAHCAGVRAGGREGAIESVHLTKDGRAFPVELKVNFVEFDGNEFHCTFARDITRRKQAEEERMQLEAQVQHAQKLESLGVLAGGIAHDFNNLLVGIIGHADLALLELPPASDSRNSLEQIINAGRQAAELCKQMLAYSGKGRFVIEPIDVSRLVDEMIQILSASVSKRARFHPRLASGLPPVEADASQIRQVIMNLLTNASEALGDRNGAITISTGLEKYRRTELDQYYLGDDLPDGEYVFLEVADSGCGMDEETCGRMFEPFFSTKFTGRGLGMAAVLGIVRGHKGAIRVDSVPGSGTTITVLFPASAAGAVHPPPARITEPEQAWQGSGTVLVIDDEPHVRAVAEATLRRMGFQVLMAEDGAEGVEIFRKNPGGIACILLDYTMPNMDGRTCLAEIRRMDQDAKIIMTSGYNEVEVTGRFEALELDGFVQKPFEYRTMAATMERVLSHEHPVAEDAPVGT